MTNYEVTVGYKAVVSVSVKADNEKDAKEKAVEVIRKRRDVFNQGKCALQDDSFAAHGVVDMDETWTML